MKPKEQYIQVDQAGNLLPVRRTTENTMKQPIGTELQRQLRAQRAVNEAEGKRLAYLDALENEETVPAARLESDRITEAKQTFRHTNPEYFYSKRNSKAIHQYIAEHGLPLDNPQSYQIAYDYLTLAGVIETAPVQTAPPPGPTVIPPIPTVALSQKGTPLTPEQLKELREMPLEELKKKVHEANAKTPGAIQENQSVQRIQWY